jgi:hypothetical protein
MPADRPTRVAVDLVESAAAEGLRESERLVANAELDVAIQTRAESISFGARLAAEGLTTVALADDGTLIEHRPDGSEEILAAPDPG